MHLFTSESVSVVHSDKCADIIRRYSAAAISSASQVAAEVFLKRRLRPINLHLSIENLIKCSIWEV